MAPIATVLRTDYSICLTSYIFNKTSLFKDIFPHPHKKSVAAVVFVIEIYLHFQFEKIYFLNAMLLRMTNKSEICIQHYYFLTASPITLFPLLITTVVIVSILFVYSVWQSMSQVAVLASVVTSVVARKTLWYSDSNHKCADRPWSVNSLCVSRFQVSHPITCVTCY